MKHFHIQGSIISFVTAAVFVVSAYVFIPATENVNVSGAEEEESGAHWGSRKYFEYMRNRNPETGEIPAGIFSRAVSFANHLPKSNNLNRDYTWESRGPFNKGGRTRAFAVDVLNSNVLLAGSVTGGMWRSSNAGQTWTKTTTPDQLASVSCIAQDTRAGHQNVWYYGSGEEFYGVVSGTSFTALLSGDGMWKSIDNGQTWSHLLSTASGTPQNIMQNGSYDFVWRIVPDHTNLTQDVVYAAVYNGVIRSWDGGQTWEHVLGFTTSASEFVDIMMTPSGVLYATFGDNSTNGGGFFRSTDGTNWTAISPGNSPIANLRRTVMTYNPQNENEIYFLGEALNNANYPIGHFLYKYTYVDGTAANDVWENRSANLPSDPCNLYIGVDFDFGTFRTQNSYDMCIAHHPTQPNVLFIGGCNIHRSTDAFATPDNDKWIGGYRCNPTTPWQYSYPNHHSDQHSFAFDWNNPNKMYNTNDGGLYRTDDVLADSISWTPLNNGYVTTQFYTNAIEQGHVSNDFVMGGMQDNGSWITNTANNVSAWKEVHADDGSYCQIPEGRNFVVTSSQQGKLFKKTIDQNGNLTGTERIDPDNGPSALFINPLLLDPWTHRLFVAGNKMIWYLDGIDTISVTNNYINKRAEGSWNYYAGSTITLTQGSISCLDQAYADNSVLYFGSTQGKLFKLTDLYGNTTKTNITSSIFPTNAYTSSLATHDLNSDEVMVSFSNFGKRSIFHSLDGGSNWVDVSGNLEENLDGSGNGPAVYWVEIYPSSPAIYFAGTSAGLFSTDLLAGDNTIWSMEGANTIGNAVVNMVTARGFDGTVAVATHANGMFTTHLPPVEAMAVIEKPSPKINLTTFPNPATDVVNFQTTLQAGEQVEWVVYSMQGQRMDSRIWISNGNDKFSWNVPASGMYIYELKTKSTRITGKFVATE